MLDVRRFNDPFGIDLDGKRGPLREGWERAFIRAGTPVVATFTEAEDPIDRAITRTLSAEEALQRLTNGQVRQLKRLLVQARKDTIATLSTATKEWQIRDRSAVLEGLARTMRALEQSATTSLNAAQEEAWAQGSEVIQHSGVTLSALPHLDPEVITTAMQTSPYLITGITKDIEDKIATMIRMAALGQTSPLDLMKQMGDLTGKGVWASAFARGEAIYRTEVGRMFSTAHFERIGQMNAREPGWLKEWVAVTGDNRTRPSHVRANGQRVPVNEPFLVGDSKGMHPHDPALPARESVHCRCVMVAIRPEWETGKPPELPEQVVGQDVLSLLGDEALGALRAWAAMPMSMAARSLAERLGFTALPRVLSKAEIDRLVAAGETAWWRGVRGRSGTAASGFHDALRTGNYHMGSGIYGPGTYVAYGSQMTKYGRRIAQPIDVAREFAALDGSIVYGSISSTARIISEANVEREWFDLLGKANEIDPALVGALRLIGQTPATRALLLGYDGLRIEGSDISALLNGDQIVVLNRSALRVNGDSQVTQDDLVDTIGRTGGDSSTYTGDFDAAMALTDAVRKAQTADSRATDS